MEGKDGAHLTRPEDVPWDDFLSDCDTFDAVPFRPSDVANIRVSSRTTKNSKVVLGTQTTPIKTATDAYVHHDVGPQDILTWPTSFG
jgi:acetyl-CoA synthetase